MTAQIQILVVEDDPFISLEICQALKDFGYSVAAAVPSGEEAIVKFEELSPQLVLMDIGLKGDLDGIKTAELIQKRQSVPIIFLTAIYDEKTLQRAILTAASGYLIKPFDPRELHSSIEVALQRFSVDAGLDSAEVDEINLLSVEGSEWKDGDDKITILHQIEQFKKLPPQTLLAIAAASEVHSVEAGQFINAEGDVSQRAFIVLTGRISVTKTAVSGKELILSLLSPGDMFGLLYLLSPFAGITSARAQLDSKILTLPASAFHQLTEEIPAFGEILIQELTIRLALSYELAMGLAHSRVESRILCALVALLSSIGKGSKRAGKDTRIYITRRELADLTGTTPETAIRVTKSLERDGVLDLSRPGIIKVPDAAVLKTLAAGSGRS